jgi:hypothetical protein
MLELSDVYTVYQLKAYNAARGYHFFSPSTMRFFSSRICANDLHHVMGGIAFITSEADRTIGGNRGYTLRIMRADGRIDGISEFQEFGSLRAARSAMRQYTQEDAARYAASTADSD